ncbi:MAG: HAMP domain-containing histidine kinase [Chitinophagaceae bacterium]|jgi:signal transduction histidine kinase|nr:HAMP domain-containing histidine kinase [Chitinophagaceae bacterium]
MQSKRIFRTTLIYWALLAYIVAALVWWFISLNRQNAEMRDFKKAELHFTVDSAVNPGLYQSHLQKIKIAHKREQSKYIGEGSIFFIVILIGAWFVYRSVRRQLKLQQQQQNFMMAVTHELKTPIAVAKLSLETMQKHKLEADKQQKLIQKTLDEVGRLNFLTNNILVSSQLEGGQYKADNEELDLSLLLKDRLQDFRNRFPDRKIEETIEADADIKGDPLLLQMMINNLLGNALKYSPKTGMVTAGLKKYRSGIELQIADEGSGIADEEKLKVFSKFYRIGNEATRKTQGTGLGLYLCRKIAQSHNADISVTDNQPQGSIFTIVFKT